MESDTKLNLKELISTKEWNSYFKDNQLNILSVSREYKHILSHQKIYAQFYMLKVNNISSFKKDNYLSIKLKEINNFALPKLLRIT